MVNDQSGFSELRDCTHCAEILEMAFHQGWNCGLCFSLSRGKVVCASKTSSPKGNDAHLRAIIQSEKKWKHQFFRCLRAANSVVRGRICPNFKLIQALLYVIITCKYEKRSHQEQPRKSGNTVFQIKTLSVAMETSGRIWSNF